MATTVGRRLRHTAAATTTVTVLVTHINTDAVFFVGRGIS